MTFRAYLKRHYATACKMQRGIGNDPVIVDMLRTGGQDAHLVKKWMESYRLFQGINAQERRKIVRTFLTFAKSHTRIRRVTEDDIRALYTELFRALYRTKRQLWMSATSKLLWCLYPNDVVMYDSFVHRALLVLQRIDSTLTVLPRIGDPPRVRVESDIDSLAEHYMNYQGMVHTLMRVHAGLLKDLRERTGERYPYDLRIVDKVLWMIGSPNPSIDGIE